MIALKDSLESDFVERVRHNLFGGRPAREGAKFRISRRNNRRWRWPLPGPLEEERHLVVEAGTGVGKSLAYLVPAMLFALEKKKKAIISTQTINLQEQLMIRTFRL